MSQDISKYWEFKKRHDPLTQTLSIVVYLNNANFMPSTEICGEGIPNIKKKKLSFFRYTATLSCDYQFMP